MLTVGLARNLIMLVPPYNTHAYAVAWEWSAVPLLAAQCWAALDALTSIARLYPKLGRFAIWLFAASVGFSAVFCCAGLPFETSRLRGTEATLRSLFLLHRWINSVSAGSLFFAVLLLARFPIPVRRLPRNLVCHVGLLTAYFTSYGILYFIENIAPLGAIDTLERLQTATVLGLYVAWSACVSRGGSVSEAWPRCDPSVGQFVKERSRVAVALLRYAAQK